MSRVAQRPTDIAELQAQMRQIFPDLGPRKSELLRKVRAQNQAAVERAMQSRQRPTRVS